MNKINKLTLFAYIIHDFFCIFDVKCLFLHITYSTPLILTENKTKNLEECPYYPSNETYEYAKRDKILM